MSDDDSSADARLARFHHRARNTMQLVDTLIERFREGASGGPRDVDQLARAVRVAFLLEEATWDSSQGNVVIGPYLEAAAQAAELPGGAATPALCVSVPSGDLQLDPQPAFVLAMAVTEAACVAAGRGALTVRLERSRDDYRLTCEQGPDVSGSWSAGAVAFLEMLIRPFHGRLISRARAVEVRLRAASCATPNAP